MWDKEQLIASIAAAQRTLGRRLGAARATAEMGVSFATNRLRVAVLVGALLTAVAPATAVAAPSMHTACAATVSTVLTARCYAMYRSTGSFGPHVGASSGFVVGVPVRLVRRGRRFGDYLCTGVAGYDAPTGLGTPNGIAAF
jgi:hypothetical protein